MLRYYDEAGLLKPAKIDPFTNYRQYSATQIPTLNKIVFLRDLGFQVSDIAAALPRWDPEYIAAQLENKRLEIEGRMKTEREVLSRIAQAKEDLRQETIAVHYSVSIKSVPGYHVLSLRRTVPDYYAEGRLWKELSAFAREHAVPVSGDTFTIYHDGEYRETGVDMELCAPVARRGRDGNGFAYRTTDPVPLMACTMVSGPFNNIAGAYHAFADWLEGHNRYQMAGQCRQIVHRGPWNEANPDQYVTELQVPLEELP